MGKDYVVLQEESEDLMVYVRFLWASRWVAILIAALTFSASTVAPTEAQELKKVRIGYPPLASRFLPSLLQRTRAFSKKMASTATSSNWPARSRPPPWSLARLII